jgi:ABC-2 type transport system ATP-binding protein
VPEWTKGCDWKSHARAKTRAAGSNPAPSVRVEGLKKSYKRVHALKGISFEIKRGELFSLLGPNGAGKTTTIRILTGLTKPDEGSIFIFGKKLSRNEISAKKLIGYVPQQVNLDVELTVYENLLIHGLLFGMSFREIKERIEELLTLADLADRHSAKVKELSGGMRRRLLIVRALLHRPKILLLDEPTVGLDPHIRRKIWHLIKQIQEKGASILLTTHYMEEAEYLSDRVAFIFNGNILRVGKPKDLIEELGEFAIDIFTDDEVETQYFRDRQSAEEKMLELKSKARSIALRRTTLEDVFMRLQKTVSSSSRV